MASKSDDEDDLNEKILQLEKEKKKLERQNLKRKLKELSSSVSSLREANSSSLGASSADYDCGVRFSSSPVGEKARSSSVRLDDSASDSGVSSMLNEQRNLLRSLQRRSMESVSGTAGRRDQYRGSESESDDDGAKDSRNLDKVMSKEHKQKLQQNRDTLVENMIPDDIFNDLIANKVLTTPEVGRIKEKNTKEAINEELLDNLIRKPDRAFYEYLKSLRKTLQGHLADLIDDMIPRSDRGKMKRKRRTGELNISVDCEDVSPVGRKRPACTCAEVEEQILQMAKTAYKAIRRRDGTPASFQQFKKELHETNDMVKESMEIMHTLKILCKHGDLDISYGSVRFTLNCSSMMCVQNVWKMYKSGKLQTMFQEKFVSRQLLKICSARTIKLGVRIAEQEYIRCIQELDEAGVSLGSCTTGKRKKPTHHHSLRNSRISALENGQENAVTPKKSSNTSKCSNRKAFQEIEELRKHRERHSKLKQGNPQHQFNSYRGLSWSVLGE